MNKSRAILLLTAAAILAAGAGSIALTTPLVRAATADFYALLMETTAKAAEPDPVLDHSHDSLSLREWQGHDEDVHSIAADPLFVNPSYPADDFRLRSHSPAFRIRFAPSDPGQAGGYRARLRRRRLWRPRIRCRLRIRRRFTDGLIFV